MIFKKNGKYTRKVKSLEPWFHNLHLPDGSQTAPNHFLGDFPKFKWEQFQLFIPENLKGKTVLDIGCNAGFYSIELAKRGADVTAIDLDPHFLRQAKWASKIFHLEKKIKLLHMQVYDIINLKERFDIVFFLGVFYHLRYPVLALDIVTQKVKEIMVFQTLTMPGNGVYDSPEDIEINKRNIMLEEEYPKMAFIENKLAGDPTNWWAPNYSAVISLMKTCGLKLIANPGHEIFIFEKEKETLSVYESWNNSEFKSATGRKWKDSLSKKVNTK